MVYLTRKAEFSASQYYHNPEFSPEENRRIFGKCNNPHKEVEEFRDVIPTTENLAIAIWNWLQPKLKVAQLHRVRLYETPDLFVDFYGEA